MKNKLTYKIQNILVENDYTEVIVKHKQNNEEVTIQNAQIRFRYEPERDKGCLSFGKSKEDTVCEVSDKSIKEVIVYNDSLSIETEEKSYYCYQSQDKRFY
ncbi:MULTISPECIES: hypothetical protein [Clostridia]|uniref:hypothetical protein n=1 Tax=Clostridium sp. CCUG 7971 TaxID=2811414 RepID=UPI001ABB175A|nr:hypothetical protein [Clostridium sp. CCUG 7971]MBO3444723.1 hypothetical protein [Clostridium sp. CCUG 7971]